MTLKKICSLILILTLAAALLSGCGEKEPSPSASETSGIQIVKVGVCGSSHGAWNAVQKILDEENAGIWIQLVEFDAYNLPNEALSSGEIDLNSFQHKAYLRSDCSANGYDLSVIGETVIAPLSLYSRKYGSIEELKAAAENSTQPLLIGVPNDGTNLSRAIKLLETAGLIQVDPAAGYTPELKDVTSYLYNIEISPVAANTLTSTLEDYAASTVNGTYAVPFGLVPSKDALLTETQSEGEDNPYVNVIVSRTEDKDNPIYKKIVDAYRTQLVAEFTLEFNHGSSVPVFDYDADYQAEEDFVNSILSYESPNRPK